MKFFLIATLMLTFISPVLIFSQSPAWTVVTRSLDTLREVTISSLQRDTVVFQTQNGIVSLPVDSVKSLHQYIESSFWKRAGTGTLVGTVAGGVIGIASYTKPRGGFIDIGPAGHALGGAVLGAATGFLVGAISGAFSGGETSYDFTDKSLEEKIKILRELHREYLIQ
ncbi:MAG: glycine zipper family protein [Ignavibacteriae bacterium]|nr:glycine zipper family protein [Ignavibacteriota bacterium]